MRRARAGVRECARECERVRECARKRERVRERERESIACPGKQSPEAEFVNHGWPFPLDSPSYVE